MLEDPSDEMAVTTVSRAKFTEADTLLTRSRVREGGSRRLRGERKRAEGRVGGGRCGRGGDDNLRTRTGKLNTQ